MLLGGCIYGDMNLGLVFQNHPVAPGMLSLPMVTGGFGRLSRPFPIRQQRKEFNSAKKPHRVRV